MIVDMGGEAGMQQAVVLSRPGWCGMQVPVWFCMACPLVLGLLAPFVWNLGLTAAAEAVCQHYRLPDDQCNELWCAVSSAAIAHTLTSAHPWCHMPC